MQFHSTATAAHWDDAAGQWTASLEGGEQAHSRFLFTAVGIQSAYTLPSILGLESFRGPAYHPARWPKTRVDFTGKRSARAPTPPTLCWREPDSNHRSRREREGR
jgi:cation diffusion facilitator CzcD-associated flavoprotein CzcO